MVTRSSSFDTIEKNVKNEKKRVRFHDGYTIAMQLTLYEYRKYLDYHHELTLRNQSSIIDLVIRKDAKKIPNIHPLIEFFDVYTIIEYKSPGKSLNSYSFMKMISYCSDYRIKQPGLEGYELRRDTAYIFFRYDCPTKFISFLKEYGYHLEKNHVSGIYKIIGDTLFNGYLIIGKLLPDTQDFILLKSIRKDLNLEDIRKINNKVQSFHFAYGSPLWHMITDYMQIIKSANYKTFLQAKEEQDMCETILKIFEPEINEKLKKDEADKKQSLLDAVKKLIRFGVSDAILYSTFGHDIVNQARTLTKDNKVFNYTNL